MDDWPTKNWTDGSLTDVVTSVTKINGEYLFLKSQLDALAGSYQDIWGDVLWLPVCDLDDTSDTGMPPKHAAAIVGWSTPPGVDAWYSGGLYVSKWGLGGLFCHRWGEGQLPPVYCDKTKARLKIFAPGPTWAGAPYYEIEHNTPWGMNPLRVILPCTRP